MEKRDRPVYYFISRIALPVAAIVIAALGYHLSSNSYDSNIEPQLYAGLTSKMDLVNGPLVAPPSLILINEGINEIYDIRIRQQSILFDLLRHEFRSPMGSDRDWRYCDHLQPSDSIIFPLDTIFAKFTLEHAKGSSLYLHKTPTLAFDPILIYTIRYRRMSDKKLYRTKTYAFVMQEQNTSAIWVNSFEGFLPERFQFILPKLDSIYANR
jgi:hypothetical protein